MREHILENKRLFRFIGGLVIGIGIGAGMALSPLLTRFSAIVGIVEADTAFSLTQIPYSWLRDTLEAREKESELDWKLGKLAMCESGGNPERINPKDTNGVPAYGLFQYQEKTWNEQIGKYGLLPNAEPAEYMNFIMDGELQWRLTDKILRDGGERHWGNCLQ